VASGGFICSCTVILSVTFLLPLTQGEEWSVANCSYRLHRKPWRVTGGWMKRRTCLNKPKICNFSRTERREYLVSDKYSQRLRCKSRNINFLSAFFRCILGTANLFRFFKCLFPSTIWQYRFSYVHYNFEVWINLHNIKKNISCCVRKSTLNFHYKYQLFNSV